MSDPGARLAGVLGLEAAGGPALGEIRLEQILGRKRDELRQAAKLLGLTGVSKLSKDELARRVHAALRARAAAPPPAAPRAAARAAERPAVPAPAPKPVAAPEPSAEPEVAALTEAGLEPAAAAKLDLGPAARAGERPVEHIPWSYGKDRVTAAAVDPDRLYVYWEVTDPAMEDARAQLGPGGPGAWLCLRVYDTSGRLFDGTNARSYFDHQVGRSDRQWFFHIGKPTSTAVVEIGMKSAEGFFARMARSGRVDFPRAEPAPWSEPEWMTVRVSGEVEHAGRGAPARPRPAPAPTAGGEGPAPSVLPLWELRLPPDAHEGVMWQLLEGGFERTEWSEVAGQGWVEVSGRVEWQGPMLQSSWESGPFTHPVEILPPEREEWRGRSFAYKVGGVTHVVYGPWQVVIRNLGTHAAGPVRGRWEVWRSWVSAAGREVRVAALPGRGPGGASELAVGASERRWIAASELRLGGASEVWRLGASEVRLRGASEVFFAGASQWMLGGASERRFLGASEVRLGGASERRLAGASELRLAGASERRLGGASELRLGASEQRLGASEQRLGASEGRLGDGAAPGGDAPAEGAYPKLGR